MPPQLIQATLPPQRVRIEFDRPATLSEDGLTVTEIGGKGALALASAGRRRVFDWPCAWRPNREYRLEFTADDVPFAVTISAPGRATGVAATLEIPAGQESVALGQRPQIEAAVAENGELNLGVTVENHLHERMEYEFEIALPEGVTYSQPQPEWRREGHRATLAGALQLEHDYRQAVCGLSLAAGVVSAEAPLTLRWRKSVSEFDVVAEEAAPMTVETSTLVLRRTTRAELASAVDVADVMFPADPLGQRQLDRQSDTVVLPDAWWQRLRSWLHPGREWDNPYDAYAHHAVWLRNRAAYPLHLLIESDVAPEGSAPGDLSFAPPRWAAPRESSVSEHLLRLAPHETACASLPCFVRPTAQAGHYVRRFRVFALGDTTPLVEFSRPLHVLRGNPRVALMTALGAAVACGTWLMAAWRGRQMVAQAGAGGLAAIGLLSGVQFVVSYASRIGSDLLAGALGPFNVLVTGLGHEGLTSLVAAATVVLFPRPGTYLLSSAALFALNGIFSGQLGLVDILFVSVGIGLTEAALAATGVTVGQGLAPAAEPGRGTVARVALAVGAANALTLAVQFSLYQVLHRLYFAPWFVALVALWTGLVYGALGAAVGTRWGYRLRRVLR